jgi:hypothetical protein
VSVMPPEYKTFLDNYKKNFVGDPAKDPFLNPKPPEPEQFQPPPPSPAPYPREVGDFTSWLIRQGYIRTVAAVLPGEWRGMSDQELTAYLSARYTEDELKTIYLAKWEERQAIKAGFRKLNIINGIVIGLIWARENVKNEEWGTAIAKVTGGGVAAYAFNRMLYARDATAAAKMAEAGDNFGKWFNGAARTNYRLNLFMQNMLIADLAAGFRSGGVDPQTGIEYPSIPWDIIYLIDIHDKSTWYPPNQKLLDLGFNIWYQQKCTPMYPEACETNIYLGHVDGSIVKTILEATILSRPAE